MPRSSSDDIWSSLKPACSSVTSTSQVDPTVRTMSAREVTICEGGQVSAVSRDHSPRNGFVVEQQTHAQICSCVGDVYQTKAITRSCAKQQGIRPGLTVDEHHVSKRSIVAKTEEKSVVAVRVKFLAMLKNNERAVESVEDWSLIVPMAVIDEGAGARRGEARQESRSWRDGGRKLLARSGPSGNSVVVALEFHAVPMDSRWAVRLIPHFDFYRLSACENNRRAQ